jgi:hypothetical protein
MVVENQTSAKIVHLGHAPSIAFCFYSLLGKDAGTGEPAGKEVASMRCILVFLTAVAIVTPMIVSTAGHQTTKHS